MYMKLHIPDSRNRDWTCALFIIKKIFSFSKRKKEIFPAGGQINKNPETAADRVRSKDRGGIYMVHLKLYFIFRKYRKGAVNHERI